MAISQNPYVHMETMEETKDEGKKSEKDGSTGRFGMAGRKQPPWVLVYNTHNCHQYGNDKRKTDKQWLLWFSHSLSVCAHQRLKAPCTERYARCCERTGVNHSLLLDWLDVMKKTNINLLIFLGKTKARDGNRTRDPLLGKEVLHRWATRAYL